MSLSLQYVLFQIVPNQDKLLTKKKKLNFNHDILFWLNLSVFLLFCNVIGELQESSVDLLFLKFKENNLLNIDNMCDLTKIENITSGTRLNFIAIIINGKEMTAMTIFLIPKNSIN